MSAIPVRLRRLREPWALTASSARPALERSRRLVETRELIEKLPIRSRGQRGERTSAGASTPMLRPRSSWRAVPVADRAVQRRHQHVAGVARVRDVEDARAVSCADSPTM